MELTSTSVRDMPAVLIACGDQHLNDDLEENAIASACGLGERPFVIRFVAGADGIALDAWTLAFAIDQIKKFLAGPIADRYGQGTRLAIVFTSHHECGGCKEALGPNAGDHEVESAMYHTDHQVAAMLLEFFLRAFGVELEFFGVVLEHDGSVSQEADAVTMIEPAQL